MRATSRALALTVLLVPLAAARAEKPLRLEQALRLQEELQRAVERAEPAIASVLVSRNEAYRKWQPVPQADAPGKLGRFDVAQALRGLRDPTEQQKRAVKELDLSDPDVPPESFGSGVVLDESGLVLTNAHVVRGATKVYVRLPGGRGSWADVHASDPRSDLAVLRLLGRVPGLKALKLGDGGKVRKGQFVLSLANPYTPGFRDFRPRAAWGLVSNLRVPVGAGNLADMDRSKITLHHYGTLIETDTRSSLGCSGGALLNLQGELVGITTSLVALGGKDSPGSYAVPLGAAMHRIIDRLLRGAEVEYGFLGVNLGTSVRLARGVQLGEVIAGSPAQRAGLNLGDVIVRINGQPVRRSEDLFLLIGMELAGTPVRIEAVQAPFGERRTKEFTVKLAKYYVPGPIIAANRPPARGGLRVDYTSVLHQRVGFPRWGRRLAPGVLIREVLPDSPADKAQLEVDRIITHVNGRTVTTPADYYREMARAVGPVELTLRAPRGEPERVVLDIK